MRKNTEFSWFSLSCLDKFKYPGKNIYIYWVKWSFFVHSCLQTRFISSLLAFTVKRENPCLSYASDGIFCLFLSKLEFGDGGISGAFLEPRILMKRKNL